MLFERNVVGVWLTGIVLGTGLTVSLGAAGATTQPTPTQRFIVVARDAAAREALRAEIMTAGGTVVRDLQPISSFVVSGPDSLRQRLGKSTFIAGIAADRIVQLVSPASADRLHRKAPPADPGPGRVDDRLHGPADPAIRLHGLLWNLARIHAPQAWDKTLGSASVKVGVADTGVDFTHPELRSRIDAVVDFTDSEVPPLCQTFFGASDRDFAALTGGPETTDWHGHGTWVGGNIGAALDHQGINGIAPKVRLVALKIAQWCGSSYQSTILDAILYAANNGIDVVNISFAGYLDRSDPEQDLIYMRYVEAVKYAWLRGTTIVASSGDEHIRIGEGGLVLSHGTLSVPGSFSPALDLFGLWEVPGGIPGVVNVSATNNKVAEPSHACAAGTMEDLVTAICKPKSDAHQPTGVGKKNQLAYYSNYGPRIDIAAPGGARKFNLPDFDRGGTPGWPYTTDDGFKAWDVFSTTSNWALVIPCFMVSSTDFPSPRGCDFPADQAYSSIEGTSMAAPHVSATLALMASARSELRRRPDLLVPHLLDTAHRLEHNTTQPLSETDTSPADLTGLFCFFGYCHLGGDPISDDEAYGAGLLNTDKAVKEAPHAGRPPKPTPPPPPPPPPPKPPKPEPPKPPKPTPPPPKKP